MSNQSNSNSIESLRSPISADTSPISDALEEDGYLIQGDFQGVKRALDQEHVLNGDSIISEEKLAKLPTPHELNYYGSPVTFSQEEEGALDAHDRQIESLDQLLQITKLLVQKDQQSSQADNVDAGQQDVADSVLQKEKLLHFNDSRRDATSIPERANDIDNLPNNLRDQTSNLSSLLADLLKDDAASSSGYVSEDFFKVHSQYLFLLDHLSEQDQLRLLLELTTLLLVQEQITMQKNHHHSRFSEETKSDAMDLIGLTALGIPPLLSAATQESSSGGVEQTASQSEDQGNNLFGGEDQTREPIKVASSLERGAAVVENQHTSAKSSKTPFLKQAEAALSSTGSVVGGEPSQKESGLLQDALATSLTLAELGTPTILKRLGTSSTTEILASLEAGQKSSTLPNQPLANPSQTRAKASTLSSPGSQQALQPQPITTQGAPFQTPSKPESLQVPLSSHRSPLTYQAETSNSFSTPPPSSSEESQLRREPTSPSKQPKTSSESTQAVARLRQNIFQSGADLLATELTAKKIKDIQGVDAMLKHLLGLQLPSEQQKKKQTSTSRSLPALELLGEEASSFSLVTQLQKKLRSILNQSERLSQEGVVNTKTGNRLPTPLPKSPSSSPAVADNHITGNQRIPLKSKTAQLTRKTRHHLLNTPNQSNSRATATNIAELEAAGLGPANSSNLVNLSTASKQLQSILSTSHHVLSELLDSDRRGEGEKYSLRA